MIYVEARRKLVEWLRRQLVGPASEDNLRVSPLDRYPTGVLYPIQPGVSGMDPAAPGGAHDAEAALDPTAPSRVDDAGLALAGDEDEDEDTLAGLDAPEGRTVARPVSRRRYVPPSAVGFSFFVRGDPHLSIAVSAAAYTRSGDRGDQGRFKSLEYERTALGERVVTWSVSGAPEETLWGGRAGIDVRTRPFLDGRILTVTLFNRQRLDRDESVASASPGSGGTVVVRGAAGVRRGGR